MGRERARGGRILWCGSGGLAQALAGPIQAPIAVPSGPTLLVIGTDHPVAAAQIDAMRVVDPEAVIAWREGDQATQVGEKISRRLAAKRVAVLVPDISPRPRDEAARTIAAKLTPLLHDLRRRAPCFAVAAKPCVWSATRWAPTACNAKVSLPTAYRSADCAVAGGPASLLPRNRAPSERQTALPLYSCPPGPPSALMRTSMNPMTSRLCITMGDPAGIGPEIVLKAAAALSSRGGGRRVLAAGRGLRLGVLDEAAASWGWSR